MMIFIVANMAQEHTFPMLYSVTSKKAIRYWCVKANVDEAGVASYTREYGQKDKKPTKVTTTVPEAKSKATPFLQAIFEAQSSWDEKKNKKGYVENLDTLSGTVVTQLTGATKIKLKPKSSDAKAPNEMKTNDSINTKDSKQPLKIAISKKIQIGLKKNINTDANTVKPYSKYESFKFLPMLANKYTERKHNIVFPCLVQEKIDGIRYTSRLKQDGSVMFMSRNDEEAPFFYEVKQAISTLKLEAGVFLDGELYSSKIPFKTLNGYCNRKKIDGKTGYGKIPKEELESIHYCIFDCYFAEQPSKPFKERYEYLKALLANNQNKYIRLVECIQLNNEDEIMEQHNKYFELGYEGIMVRNHTGVYKLKDRSSDLQKYKKFDDSEFPIVGAECSHDNKQAGCIIWVLGVPGTDLTFTCTSNTKEPDRRADWEAYCADPTQFIGKDVTVKYQGKYDNGKPRFPKVIAMRHDLKASK